MIELRGFTVSIGYAEFLKITLPANILHFKECLVITSPDDHATQEVARSVPGVELFVTDAATRHGAMFNKGLCFEEAWDHWGRHGWFCIWDADIVLPEDLHRDWMKPEKLYGARRRILEDPSKYKPGMDWRKLPVHYFDGGPIGFLQLFNAEAPDIRDKRPWYDVSFPHAGGGDSYFMELFKPRNRSVLGIDCLHLGPPFSNWYGTDPGGRRLMAKFSHKYKLIPGMRRNPITLADGAGELVERVEVPGYKPSTYEIGVVRQAKQAK